MIDDTSSLFYVLSPEFYVKQKKILNTAHKAILTMSSLKH